MAQLIKPPMLKKGDTIRLITPSSNVAVKTPHRLEQAKNALSALGYEVTVGKHALLSEDPESQTDYLSGTVSQRVQDIHDAFMDPEVKAIICTIGGDWSNELIPHLNYKLIRKNPKIFVGYSDITVLHQALQSQAGIVTFYGPAALTQFGEYPKPIKYTIDHFTKAVADTTPIGRIDPSPEWTDELLNWFERKDTERARVMTPNRGYEWLRTGSCEGKIFGGCLASLMHTLGTKYEVPSKGKVLFWEISEGEDMAKGPSVGTVSAQLQDLKNHGVLEDIVGMVIGRPYHYSNEDIAQLKSIILDKCKEYSFPILFNADIGHTDPIITVPLGTEVALDSRKNLFAFTEPGVKPEPDYSKKRRQANL